MSELKTSVRDTLYLMRDWQKANVEHRINHTRQTSYPHLCRWIRSMERLSILVNEKN